MIDYRLLWANNTSWRWTRDISAFKAQMDVGAVVRMTVAFASGAYVFASDGSGAGAIEIVHPDADTYIATYTAPLADLRAKRGVALLDCRIEMPDGATAPMFAGSVTVRAGVTTDAGDASSQAADGIADTVIVVGEADPTPVPLPAGLTAILAACRAAQAAAEAAVAGRYDNATVDAKDAATLASANGYTDAAVSAITLDWSAIDNKPAFSILATLAPGAGVAAALAIAANTGAGLVTRDTLGSAAFAASSAFDAAGAASAALTSANGYTDTKIAALTAGSPADLDTFLEVYNRFLSDESTLSSLNSTVAGKLSISALGTGVQTALANAAGAAGGFATYNQLGAAALLNVGAGLRSSGGSILFGDNAGVTYDATNRALTLGGATVTTSNPVLNLSQTWNAGAVAFAGFKLNITDTSSAAGSLLADWQVGGASKFSARKDGSILVANDARISRQFDFGGIVFNSDNTLTLGASGTGTIKLGGRVYLTDDAANILALRNGTSAQVLRVYNTFTDVSNGEWVQQQWVGNVAYLQTAANGTGTVRDLEIGTSGVANLNFRVNGGRAWFLAGGTGNFLANTDNAFDIGAGGANRPRNVYVAGLIATGAGGFQAQSTGYGLFWQASTTFRNRADGVLTLSNYAENDFGRLQFGGATASFPALKRSGASLQSRLADDSAFALIQGKHQTDTNYTAGAPTATGYLTLYDAAGTAYKVLCAA